MSQESGSRGAMIPDDSSSPRSVSFGVGQAWPRPGVATPGSGNARPHIQFGWRSLKVRRDATLKL
jgi:hypothetical protein